MKRCTIAGNTADGYEAGIKIGSLHPDLIIPLLIMLPVITGLIINTLSPGGIPLFGQWDIEKMIVTPDPAKTCPTQSEPR